MIRPCSVVASNVVSPSMGVWPGLRLARFFHRCAKDAPLLRRTISQVTVSDRPGGIAELATLLAQSGASIKDMFHERAWLRTDIFCVRVKVVVEVRARVVCQ